MLTRREWRKRKTSHWKGGLTVGDLYRARKTALLNMQVMDPKRAQIAERRGSQALLDPTTRNPGSNYHRHHNYTNAMVKADWKFYKPAFLGTPIKNQNDFLEYMDWVALDVVELQRDRANAKENARDPLSTEGYNIVDRALTLLTIDQLCPWVNRVLHLSIHPKFPAASVVTLGGNKTSGSLPNQGLRLTVPQRNDGKLRLQVDTNTYYRTTILDLKNGGYADAKTDSSYTDNQ